MPNLPVRAAGQTLNVDELSEALSGLAGNDPVYVDGKRVYRASPGRNGLQLTTGNVGNSEAPADYLPIEGDEDAA